MAKQTKVFVIDDTEFEIEQLGGVEGLDLFDRLTAELGPQVMGAIVAALGSKDPESAMGLVLLGALVKLPADFKQQLRERFAARSKLKTGGMSLTLSDGGKLPEGGVFDQHFAGRFGHMTRWLLACLKWSFLDFLPSSPASDAANPTAAKSPSPSPTG